MIQPDELKKDQPLEWSPGKGTDVWAMFQAAIAGNVAVLRDLLSKDPALVRGAWNYRAPLYFAVCENQIEAARLLLEHGAHPVNAWGDDTLLDIAKDRGHTDMLRLLEEFAAARHSISPRAGEVAAAIRERDVAKTRTLIEASPELLHAAGREGGQPIHWAVKTRNLEMIDTLLALGADINAKTFDGARPLQLTNGDYSYRGWRDVPKEVTTTPREVLDHLRARGAYVDVCTAAAIGDLDRVRTLLDEDPTLANRTSEYVTYYLGSGSPLRNAASQGHIEIVKLLLDRGADPNLREEGIAPKGAALYSAVYDGHYEIAKLLLERGAYPNPPMESSADALSIALMNKREDLADLLCSYGASRSMDILAYYGDVRTAAAVLAAKPELANDPGAFGNAVAEGNEAFVRLMLRYRPDLARRVGIAGKTRELTELLFAHGMDPNHRDWMLVTPLHQFARKNEIENAAIFLDHGADIHARDEELNSTPLAWAAKFGKIRMVEFLLRRGTHLMLPDDPPWATPLAWAKRRGHQDVVQLLERFAIDGWLPPSNLDPYEVLVKDLMTAFATGDASALERLTTHFKVPVALTQEMLRAGVPDRLGKAPANEDHLTLEEARLLVARASGFTGWSGLEKSLILS